ncbi:probable transcription factor At1g11510 [Macadamia integrifolia]|uniref:probable transcription factor At1g11510 n=1 Tax=Macadamia integrifolia TaxID=60698 RepID=UPI001C4FFB91|nr:probable transcription factor At1g11510 [Macadamia integrifolia]
MPISQSKFTAPVKCTIKSHEEDDGKDSKRRKKKAMDVEEEDAENKSNGDNVKKMPFQMVWFEDYELGILKGMLDYYSQKGSEAYNNMTDFHEFIKNTFHVDVSKNQLSDKVRRLRKRFMNNACKGKEGNDLVFSKSHKNKVFKLSKKI